MAMIECDECGAQISSKAAACPQCGNPMNYLAGTAVPAPTVVRRGFNFKLWIGLPLVVFVVLVVISSNSKPDPQAEKARREECVKALMSNMDTSTRGYADRQAYEAHVASKCEGYDLKR
jgi:hypothetical protein